MEQEQSTVNNVEWTLKKLKNASKSIILSTKQFADNFNVPLLEPLRKICDSIGIDKPVTPQLPPPEYSEHWKEFLLGRRKILDNRTLRNLCWEPEIASDVRFVDYISDKDIQRSSRALQGLVWSCHKKWLTVRKNSVFKKESLLDKVRGLIEKYSGTNRVVTKWQNALDIVLSNKGSDIFASDMIENNRTLKNQAEYWSVDMQTEFFSQTLYVAYKKCMEMLLESGSRKYFFSELLSSLLWDISIFKEQIGDLILDSRMTQHEELRTSLQNFILGDERLGDPRLRGNNVKWLDIEKDARDRFIQWLSKEDIGFFFEHVLPDSVDRQGRKEFWLRYVKNLHGSRPLLCRRDKYRLTWKGHYGEISGTNSAFILDFGNIVAVEFSKVGSCYLYSANDFKQILPELFGISYFTEADLKNRDLAIEHVRHITGNIVDWKRTITRFLARNGIR
ncbi:MAG: EH signature domain-containing protein [Nitrospiraceae bacterium]|nr:EH signature domain-containing protein [Nitrospiraceae bacterium]